MLQVIQVRLLSFFNGHERSVKAKKNILILIAIKGTAAILSLILLPLTIRYVSARQYGMWLTITSLISWTVFFDIGLGNGLRNKLAAALTRGNFYRARCYVSTTYAVMSWLGGLIRLAGITLSNALLLIIMGLVFSVQVNKIVNHTVPETLKA